MFEHAGPVSLRGLVLAGCLAMLAACSGHGSSSNETADAAMAAPAGLTASTGNAEVTLKWTVDGAATGYHVKRSTTSGGPYTAVGTTTAAAYTDATVTNGTTYYYVVSALDAAGESADSAQIGASPVAPTEVPAAATDLRATPGNAQASLTWTASSGATSYDVKRSTISGGPYTQLASTTSPSYTDASVTNGVTYFYVVMALNDSGTSPASTEVSVTPDPAVTTPAVPTGFTATAGNAQVRLAWTASSGAASYHLKRSTTSGGPYTQVGAPTSPAYTDTVSNGTKYYYVVSALDSAGESANSAQVSAAPTAPVATPPVPAGLTATAGNAQASLTWTASSGATSYHLKRATTSGGTYTQVAAPTAAAYTDTGLTNGTTYYYVVSALDSAGESANSAQVSAAPSVPGSGAIAVTGLHVSGNQILNGQNQTVHLRGTDKSGTEYMCLDGPLVFDGPSDANSVTTLKSWAINIVRLPVNEDCWLGINGVAVGGTAYQTAITNYVSLLTAANIATIIDLQWAAPGTTLSNQQTPMPDADNAPSFWKSVANTFKGNSTVIFDLFNEPFPDSNNDSTAAWACLENGGTCPGVAYTAAGMQSLVTTIRATGSTNIIMVAGVQYANRLDQWLAHKPTDPLNNVVASWHSYAEQYCNNSGCWSTEIQPVMASVPLIAGEIGENDCAHGYIDPLMAFLDGKGGGYLAWGWNTYNCSSFPAVISDYAGTPTAYGVGFHDHLLQLQQMEATNALRSP